MQFCNCMQLYCTNPLSRLALAPVSKLTRFAIKRISPSPPNLKTYFIVLTLECFVSKSFYT